MTTSPEKIAPVQGYVAGIPWSLHLEAYDAYSKKWAPQPAMIDLESKNCRGGFSTGELDQFIPGWRDKVSEIGRLKARIAELEASVTAAEIGKVAMSLIGELTGGQADADDEEEEAYLNGSARGIGNLHAELLKIITLRTAPAAEVQS